MAAMILHFVRHGRAKDVDGRCIGHTDQPLAHEGRTELKALRREFASSHAQFVSSDLRRARESAGRLTTAPVVFDPRLREMYFGSWEGKTWAELEARDGPALEEWMQDWTTIRAPDGESFSDVIVRVGSWLASVPRDGPDLVVVAHAGSIRAAAVLLLDLPPARAFSLAVDHAHVSSFSLSSQSATLLRWNSRGL